MWKLPRAAFAAATVLFAAIAMSPSVGLASTCSTSDVTTSTACMEESGNNENQLGLFNPGPLFGISNWTEVVSSDDSNGADGVLSMTGANALSGTWSVSSFGGHADAILVVKGGDGFVAYLLNTADLSGTWSTNGLTVGSGNHPDLSHLALYEGGPLATTPLPAALPLFAGGLGMVGFLARRKKRRPLSDSAAA
jgi:hypothetical protein